MGGNDWVEENLTYITLSSTTTLNRKESEIESQGPPLRKVSFLERIFRPSDVPAFEESLRRQIPSEDEGNRFIKTYHRFNQKPLYRLMEGIVWYGTFVPENVRMESGPRRVAFPETAARVSLQTRSGSWMGTRSDKDGERLAKEKLKISFGDLLLKFSDALMGVPEDCFQLCVLVSEIPSSHQAFSFNDKLKASLRKDYLQLCSTPKLAVIYVLKMHWKLSEDVLYEMLAIEPDEELEEEDQFLPSRALSRAPADIFAPAHIMRTSLKLTWIAQCPAYTSDLDIYVWQKYGAAPSPEYVKLFLCTSYPRAITLFSHGASAARFRSLRCGMPSYSPSVVHHQVPEKEHKHERAAYFEAAQTVVALFRLVADSSASFLVALRKQVKFLTYEGRKNPSGSKVQFLMHLNDTRLLSLTSLQENLCLLAETKASLRNHASQSTYTESLEHELSLIATDIEALITSLDDAGLLVINLRKMVYEELNLSQMQRSAILAILATLYVPISFLCSLFGMNITPSSMGQAATNISSLASSLVNSTGTDNNANGTIDMTALSPAQLESMIDYVSAQGNYMWDMKWYWILTVPLLLVSIVLPMFAGSMLRTGLQSMAQYRVYWRLGISLFLVSYIVAVYGVLFNTWMEDGNEVLGTVYNVVARIVYAALAVVKIRKAVRLRRRRALWISWGVCVLACTVLGLTGDEKGDENNDRNEGIKVRIGGGWVVALWDIMPWIILLAGSVWPGTMRCLGRWNRRKMD